MLDTGSLWNILCFCNKACGGEKKICRISKALFNLIKSFYEKEI